MKNIFYTACVLLAIYTMVTSCEQPIDEFLDKAPGVDVTEDTIFSSKQQLETFIASCYEQGIHTGFPYMAYYYGSKRVGNLLQGNAFTNVASCDEAEYSTGWFFPNHVNNGAVSLGMKKPQNFDILMEPRWTAIRMLHTVLERIEEVPGLDPGYISQVKGEMRFLRAMNYFNLLIRYGGSPLIDKRLPVFGDNKIHRSSLDSTVQFIVNDCDFAAANLPDVYPSNMHGRITKGAALALKARTLLYAASPLFNAATPYLGMPDAADNRLLCYGNYSVDRWKKAADAAKAVLDWAPSGGIHLITDQGVDKNYKYVWEVPDNAEIIMSDKMNDGGTKSTNNAPWVVIMPAAMGSWGGILVTQNFVEKFYDKADGTPQNWEDTGTGLNAIYDGLDPRFKQSIGYNGAYWSKKKPILNLYQPDGNHNRDCKTGYWMKKFIPDVQNSVWPNTPVNWTHFRLAEAYLNYAEALNESQGPVSAAYEAVNTIRNRSGMPDLPAGLSQEEFRARVRKERGVELAFEDHRLWDIRRWMIAEEEGVMQGDMFGLKIYKEPGTEPQDFRYERYVFEQRVWHRQYYLHFFMPDEVNKGYLVQNPGW